MPNEVGQRRVPDYKRLNEDCNCLKGALRIKCLFRCLEKMMEESGRELVFCISPSLQPLPLFFMKKKQVNLRNSLWNNLPFLDGDTSSCLHEFRLLLPS